MLHGEVYVDFPILVPVPCVGKKGISMLGMLKSYNELWQDIGNFFYGLFNPELENYTNFSLSGGMIDLKLIIFGIFAVVMLASFYIIFVRTTLGRFVRAILEKQALSAECAVTLGECGLERHIFTRIALRRSYILRRVIRCVEEEEWQAKVSAEREQHESARINAKAAGKRIPVFAEPKFSKPLGECRFYIPEKDRYVAEMRFRNRGSGYPTLVFVAFVSILCMLLLFALLPQLIRLLDNVISIFSWKGNLNR